MFPSLYGPPSLGYPRATHRGIPEWEGPTYFLVIIQGHPVSCHKDRVLEVGQHLLNVGQHVDMGE